MDLYDKLSYNYFSMMKINCKNLLEKLENFDRYWY